MDRFFHFLQLAIGAVVVVAAISIGVYYLQSFRRGTLIATTPCITFRYPTDYDMTHRIITDHRYVDDKDIFGTSVITLKKATSDGAFIYRVSCYPTLGPKPQETFLAEAREYYTKQFEGNESFDTIKVANHTATRLQKQWRKHNTTERLGSDSLTISHPSYDYYVEMVWSSPFANFSQHPERIKFEQLVESMQLALN